MKICEKIDYFYTHSKKAFCNYLKFDPYNKVVLHCYEIVDDLGE